MNLKEQKIYDTCNPKWYIPDWDGEYMAIEDDYKDEATFMWFKMNLGLLDDIFPASWSGNKEEILDALYCDQEGFVHLVSLAMYDQPYDEVSESEALCQYNYEHDWKQLLADQRTKFKGWDEFWREILCRYVENELRELFQEGFNQGQLAKD